MLSSHYAVLYGHHFNWIILALLVAGFIALLHVVVSRRAGVWALGPVATLGVAAFLVNAAPSLRELGRSRSPPRVTLSSRAA